MMPKYGLMTGLATAMLAMGGPVWAQSEPVRIGVLNDQSGPLSATQGPGSVIAARLAIEDFGGTVAGRPIELVVADHQNKSDVGSNIARQWFEVDGVDMILDLPNSSVTFAVAYLATEMNKVVIPSGGGSADLTGSQCSPNIVHWTYDTWAYGHGIGKVVTEDIGKSWYFITSDYAFGHDLEAETSAAAQAAGGSVLGAVRHPFGTNDFSSFVLQAQASGAEIIAVASSGADTTNGIMQAAEFGLTETATVVGVMAMLNNVEALGLEAAQGSYLMAPWYWDTSDENRDFAERFSAQMSNGSYPNDHQAGIYSAVLHYLKAVEALGGASGDGAAVVAQMKAMPTDDPLYGAGYIREDGRKVHPLYLWRAKKPEDSTSHWDLLEQVSMIPAEEAFRPLSEGGCTLVP